MKLSSASCAERRHENNSPGPAPALLNLLKDFALNGRGGMVQKRNQKIKTGWLLNPIINAYNKIASLIR